MVLETLGPVDPGRSDGYLWGQQSVYFQGGRPMTRRNFNLVAIPFQSSLDIKQPQGASPLKLLCPALPHVYNSQHALRSIEASQIDARLLCSHVKH